MSKLKCGHPDRYARTCAGYYRCSICDNEKRNDRRARARLLASIGEVKSERTRNIGDYSHIADADPIFGDESHVAHTQDGTRSLLVALFRSHPYVFDAAERSGRMAVRP